MSRAGFSEGVSSVDFTGLFIQHSLCVYVLKCSDSHSGRGEDLKQS